MDGEFRIGRWNVDSARGVIAADEQVVQLEPRVMDLLVYLAEHSDEVLSKERLIQSVWPDTFVADDVLTSAIWKLRQALGDDPKKPAYIQTLPRRGYQLLAEVVFPEEEIEEATSRFQLVRKLGEGAMAEVHLAEDRSLGRKVALKFLMAELEGDSNSNRRLRREARAAAALDHPFICKIYDTGRLEGRSFIAMEFLEGQTLKERLEKGHLPIPEALRIASEMAEALEVAHKKGILHRDIKPSNILLTEQGHVKITDFGIAKRIQTPDGEAQEWTGTLTQEASSIGTLPYMSPEQVKGEPLDQRSDLFSLGVVLYEMLTGLNPYFRSNQAETAGAVLHEQPSPLSEHSPEAGRLESCVRRMLAKDPNDRYQSASDVIAALQELPEPRPGAEVRPYPGLASFTAEQSDYFFGREIETDRLWQKLHRSQFLGLIGPSGGGKSSFLRAGVTPAAPDGWAIIITTPGNRPFLNLAQALSDELPGDPGTVRQLLLFEDPEVALALVSTWRNRHDEGLIALDQFEELFTLNSREVQEKFVGLLGRLVRGAGIHLLLSMRDDFLFRCHGFETLEPIFAADLTPIGPPEGSALRQALVEPARKLGFRFEEEALVEEMLEAVEGELGTLPLLAFSAEQLWVRRDEEQKLLTRDAYEEIGGVEGALAGHAEATLERIGSARISIVRELFRNLTTARGTRSVQSREQLLSVFEDEQRAEASRVLDELIDARLLVSSGLPSVEEGEKTDRIEIVHESLLTNWPRLVRWQTQDAEGAQLRDELRQAAHLWDSHDRSIDLLWTGTAVREYELWRERYPGGLSDLEEQFGDAMTLQAQQRTRRRRLAVSAVLLFALIAVITTTTLWRQSVEETRRAEAAHLLAIAQKDWEENPTDAVAYATKSLELADTESARLFVTRVLSQSPIAYTHYPDVVISDPYRFSPEGKSLAMVGVDGFHEVWRSDGSPPVRLTAHGDRVSGSSFSHDGRFMFSWTGGREEFHYIVWRFPELTQVKSFTLDRGSAGYNNRRGHPEGFIKFKRIGLTEQARAELIPFEGEDIKDLGIWPWEVEGTWQEFHFDSDDNLMVKVVDRELFYVTGIPGQPTPPRKFGELKNQAWWLQLLPNGRGFVTFEGLGESMEEINIWSLVPGDNSPPRTFRSPVRIWNAPAIDPEGTWLATAHPEDKMGLVWDLKAPVSSEPMYLRRGNMDVVNVRLHPDGTWVIAAGTDGVSFWPLSRRYPHILAREQGLFGGLAFDPAGNWLAAVTVTGKLRLWSLETTGNAEPKTLFETGGGLLAHLSVSPDGEWLATGQWNGTIQLVPVSGGETRKLTGFQSDFTAISFDQTGRRLAAAAGGRKASDRMIRVWDLDSGEVQVLDTGGSLVGRLRFEGDDLLYSSGPRGLRRWNLPQGTSELLIPELLGRFGGALSPDGRFFLGTEMSEVSGQEANEVFIYDLEQDEQWSLPSHGDQALSHAWHPNGEVIATSSQEDGTIRVSTLHGENTHVLYGHTDGCGIWIDPTGKWIGSVGADGMFFLRPMPDVSKPQSHTLPYEELMTKLKAMTNHRVVEDENSPTGYAITLDEFPGWGNVPEW